jgi:hypothetical protein
MQTSAFFIEKDEAALELLASAIIRAIKACERYIQ